MTRIVYSVPLGAGYKINFHDGGKEPVQVVKGEYSASFSDAIRDEELLSSDGDALRLPDGILIRLERLEAECDAWLTQVELGL